MSNKNDWLSALDWNKDKPKPGASIGQQPKPAPVQAVSQAAQATIPKPGPVTQPVSASPVPEQASPVNLVDQLLSETETAKQEREPDMRYVSFITDQLAAVVHAIGKASDTEKAAIESSVRKRAEHAHDIHGAKVWYVLAEVMTL